MSHVSDDLAEEFPEEFPFEALTPEEVKFPHIAAMSYKWLCKQHKDRIEELEVANRVLKGYGTTSREHIKVLEKERADLAIGYAEYKKLYEEGCKTWNPVYKKTLDRVEELKKERDEWRTKAEMADGLSVLADAGIDGHAAAITVVKKYAAHIEELKKLLAEASDRIEGLDGEAKAKGRVVVELSLALLNARRKALEEAELIALTQRCERDTAWDNACVTIADTIRALKEKE